jgi:cytochrome b6-f complex iron-sulfur subunit
MSQPAASPRDGCDTLPRRAVLLGGTGVLTLPAACAGPAAEPTGTASAGARTEPDDAVLVAVDDVPVGGAVVVGASGRPVVVARPSEDEVVGFSAVCTHQGCIVAADGDLLRCPCHGSVYAAGTGENVSGPAPRPLEAVALRVEDGEVRAG